MSCRIEGFAAPAPASPAERAALAALVARVAAELTWQGRPPRASEGSPILQIDAKPVGERDLAQCVAIAMRLSLTRPLWLWRIEAAGLAELLGSADLVAYRGQFAVYPGIDGLPSFDGQLSAWKLKLDRSVDQGVRAALQALLGEDLAKIGVRPPDAHLRAAEHPSNKPPPLVLFDRTPPAGWQDEAREVTFGRCLVQVDARGSLARIEAKIEVANPTPEPIARVLAQVRLRDAAGALIAVAEGEKGPLPPRAVQVIAAAAEVPLAGLQVATADVALQLFAAERAELSAPVWTEP